MSNILVFDTSSSWCSAALSTGDKVFAVSEKQPRKHAQVLMPMIESLCKQANIKPAQLDGIAFGKGPGSFTGLRIAISVAQGLSLATNAKLFGISSLQALAWQGMKQHKVSRVLAIMNAHMGEVFYGAYDQLTAVIDDALCKPGDVDLGAIAGDLDSQDANTLWVGAGDGFQFESELPAAISQLSMIDAEVFPLAESMMDIALKAWQDDRSEEHTSELQSPR